MKITEKISNKFRTLFDYKQPVYDPNYSGTPVSRWVLIGLAIFILGAVFYTIGSNVPEDGTVTNSLTGSSDESALAAEKEPVQSETYTVTKVVDGDTIDISANGETKRVRLIGVDTPEKNHPSKPVECFANEASSHMSQLVSGKNVTVEADASQDIKDKYDRYLYYIFVDGQNINQQMIADGYAYEYTYNTPYKYQASFKEAQVTASNGDKGLWSPTTCNGERTKPTSSSSTSAATTQSAPAAQAQSSNCDPNYSPCIPNVSYDLDCGDISVSVRVTGSDHHRFDRDGDGYGCESN